MTDAIARLPRLPATDMGPCKKCGRQLLATGLPIFTRICIRRCGIDGNAVRQTVGLAMAMGGGVDGLVLADVLGPKIDPIVVMDDLGSVNICHECAPLVTLDELVNELLAQTQEEKDDA